MKLFNKNTPKQEQISSEKPICVTGDLHYGITSEETIKKLAEEILSKNPKGVVLAGDLGEPLSNFERCLDLFKKFSCPVGVVAGNHDVWNRDKKIRSIDLWEKYLPKAIKDRGFVNLEEDNIITDSLAICGSILWYDYSVFKDQLKNGYDVYLAEKKEKYNNDGNFIDWNKKDISFAKELLDRLLKRLDKLEKNPAVKEIIVVTHVPAFPCQRVVEKGDSTTADAYFYNYTAGEEFIKYSKIKTLVSGHTHRKVSCEVIKANGKTIDVKVYPGDYRAPDYLMLR